MATLKEVSDRWDERDGPVIKQAIVNQVYEMLTLRRFADWYNDGAFDAHIRHDNNCKSEDAIKAELAKMLAL